MDDSSSPVEFYIKFPLFANFSQGLLGRVKIFFFKGTQGPRTEKEPPLFYNIAMTHVALVSAKL